ncbi:YSIRK-type signal peptide-containing protein [Staphylococcus equorum]|uniref:YSIRK-type signal peptide-containing protein n=1 Tax=Staphylococcus equorum TaxID=246432 RepID=UPI001F43E04C|nr:YSIRK-type signal peptide-containing protein [Staphylococcus equorum]MCE5048612.1 YSIRK-type signal peptide-containing protein [Staphylococcus equorum]
MRERQRFSIRKLGVGVGSVLIGLTIFATSGNVASADERQNKGDSFESVVSDKSVGEIGALYKMIQKSQVKMKKVRLKLLNKKLKM